MASFATTKRWTGVAVWALAAFLLTAWLGRADLLDPDESRHAEIAREMLADGSFVVPRLEGQPYYDKPVLFHWLVAASIATFGQDAAAARLPSVVAALWVLLVTAWWATRAYSRRVARLTVLGLATNLTFIAIGRYVILDMAFTAAVTSALAWLGVWYVERPGRRRTIYPFYAALAVAALIKGPVAFVLGGLVAACLLLRERSLRFFLDLKPLGGAVVALAIASPWYVAAWMSDPRYIETFLWEHNFARYAVAGAVTHQQPWYYYLAAIPIGLMPWTALALPAITTRLAREGRQAADVYCAAWATVVILFFLPAETKLLTYVLPAFPPIACLTAAHVASEWSAARPVARWLATTAIAWTVLIACVGIGLGSYVFWEYPELRARAPLALVALLPAAAVVHAQRRGNGALMAAAVAASSVAAVVLVYAVASGVVDDVKSLRPAAAIIANELPAAAPVVAYRYAPHSLAFYAGRTVRRTNDAAEAAVALAGDGRAALLTRAKHLPALGLQPLPHGVVERWSNRDNVVLLVTR